MTVVQTRKENRLCDQEITSGEKENRLCDQENDGLGQDKERPRGRSGAGWTCPLIGSAVKEALPGRAECSCWTHLLVAVGVLIFRTSEGLGDDQLGK
eukprot:scaffold20510_cov56-Isochrysis_galbana.AAC.1